MGLFNSNAGWGSPPPPQSPAPQQKQLSGMAPAPPAGLSSDQAGVLAQYAGSANDPYYNQWAEGVKSNKFAGTDSWFFDRFKELQSGKDAIAQQAEVEKALLQSQFGNMAQGVQSGLQGSGFGQSGFMGSELENLAAGENLGVADILNRMYSNQQQYGNNLKEGWQQDSFQKKQERNQKKDRNFQIASTALGIGTKMIGL